MTKPRIAAIVAAATLGAAAFTGAAVAVAADGTPTPSASETAPGRGMDGQGRGEHGPGGHGPGERGPGRPGERGPGGDMLHGEGVVEGPDGTYVTVRMQHGEVTAVSATSITVTSADDYSSTYSIADATVLERDGEDGAPKMGDVVHLRATVTGGSATADVIHALSPEKAQELEDRRAEMEEWMADRPEGPSGPGRA